MLDLIIAHSVVVDRFVTSRNMADRDDIVSAGFVDPYPAIGIARMVENGTEPGMKPETGFPYLRSMRMVLDPNFIKHANV